MDSPKPSLNAVFTASSFYVEASLPDENSWVMEHKAAFDKDRYQALFELGFEEKPALASPSFLWLYQLSRTFFELITSLPEIEIARDAVDIALTDDAERSLLYSLPFGIGTEYVDASWLSGIIGELSAVFSENIRSYEGTVAMFLTEKSQQLRVPERVFFHLVENKDDDGYPFAFLATYATRLPDGSVRHMPLSYALEEYKGKRDKLLTLLSCLNKAGEISPLIGSFVESGELFHALRLTSGEAFDILKAVPAIEETGILCRVPNWWKRHASSVQMQVTLGNDRPSLLGFEAILSMRPTLTVDGVVLSEDDIRRLLTQTEGLSFLKGKWIEVDHQRLQELLEKMQDYEGELSLLEALRMQTGMGEKGEDIDVGPLVTNGKWLGDLLYKLRQPSSIRNRRVPKDVHATLRPYQKTGYGWLDYMHELGFGACLADDMGLGKTLQVLTFLQHMFRTEQGAKVLLIVPASLLGNWEKEAAKFTPSLPLLILHGQPVKTLEDLFAHSDAFLTVTTYGMVSRISALKDTEWTCVILDEAQAIKNPGTKQTRTIKGLQAKHRIAMTGTPIENELTNLWSLFDFLNKGLLGSSKEFSDFAKKLEKNTEGYQKLKNMISPFILRRLKTDKTIIADLPDKLEQVDYVAMSKKQVVLYRKQVAELERVLREVDGMKRRGIVLAYITRLKQICNHPDQFLGQDTYAPEDSGKFAMLREICSTIYEKRERVLIFTQYKEIIEYLERYLESIFGAKGLILHGGTRVKKRQELVEQFNGEAYVPFMILSVKAGGTGLNLTAANHVIHFDRWWNPAVENQATDRAFRIGQEKNVIVHKLVCEGSIEEKIDALINSKKDLAENVIGSGGENWITEMNDADLLNLMRLEV